MALKGNSYNQASNVYIAELNLKDLYMLLSNYEEIAEFLTDQVDMKGDVTLQPQGKEKVQVVDGTMHPYKGDWDWTVHCKVVNKWVMRRQHQLVIRDPWIYQLIQMKPFETHIDEIVTDTLLTKTGKGVEIYLTMGYLNLTQAYLNLVLAMQVKYKILLASPEVNDFFGAKEVAGAN
ncbi:CDP-diacylglycerol--glycerol-3-phosphate 3-phosphatidyltransferase, mitochondrial [Sciurus carolinensis]|uniref:CDP-diacylglycerol--glycerol-3-phosphate 3-phosphatidyltransferase n=1 Tax=Sciurus carolinensis TaxID=30640 RepID=A0AA41T8K5_SCICA|nr:CDP-diacylglycerol--glycerol-3-phosphate 3-phosphatidyltransferase, mitochondrial [Sciurus carolinensis]